MGDAPDAQSKVQIRLTTRHSDIELPEDPGVLLVSTNLRRYALSSLVNNLLNTARPIPFEFLINGQFLRTTIDDFLTANGISAETTLNVEYTRALIPPLHVASFEHDDWVSDVDILSATSKAGKWGGSSSIQSGQERILSASYDGLLRVFDMSGELMLLSDQPNNGGRISSLKTAKFLSPSKIVSGGLDMTVRVWNYFESPSEGRAGLTPALELYGHRLGIESLAVHAPSSRLLSASSDTTVNFWSSKAADAPAAPATLLPDSTTASAKRLKLSKPANLKTVAQRGPLATLTGHTAPVSSVMFAPNDATVAYSGSHDHTLRTWDLPTSTLVDTRTTSHSLMSLAALPALNLVAAGTSARHITLIDPRASAKTIAALTLRGHTNAVVSLAVDPESAYGLVSGSHDGTCRIWDVRSVKTTAGDAGDVGGQVGESVYRIERESAKGKKMPSSGEGVKVFGVAWEKEVGIVSAGEDKQVQINKGSSGSGSGSSGGGHV
ncbi:WD40 repeat-like protein [Mytilinidion resinicola]|uniref:Ribosome biogenesis protein YTM1 n=1 Tax=Mytilinidion resinicola TaxID=574789 RepID=A0A6A6Y723_9PEZI|nr:WD40 repeat-like protein [Mytilinidion resinicola]KAF2804323.1 WD40 repeat-like protein [Mytilinidion resinicola]